MTISLQCAAQNHGFGAGWTLLGVVLGAFSAGGMNLFVDWRKSLREARVLAATFAADLEGRLSFVTPDLVTRYARMAAAAQLGHRFHFPPVEDSTNELYTKQVDKIGLLLDLSPRVVRIYQDMLFCTTVLKHAGSGFYNEPEDMARAIVSMIEHWRQHIDTQAPALIEDLWAFSGFRRVR